MGSVHSNTDPADMSRSALVFLLLGVSCGVWAEKGYETIGRLQKTLMTDYNKWVIPLVDLADRVKVAVGFNVIAFERNDKEDALSANAYFDISWKDKRLTWSPEEYGGVKQLHLPGSMLWRPDITPTTTSTWTATFPSTRRCW